MNPTATAPVIKVVELVGTSPDSWSDAARHAIDQAAQTIHGITGVDVMRSTATVTDGKIDQYRVDLKVAFVIDSNGNAGD
ncbi:MAG: dodecin family protein [Actinomycetes bacterium]